MLHGVFPRHLTILLEWLLHLDLAAKCRSASLGHEPKQTTSPSCHCWQPKSQGRRKTGNPVVNHNGRRLRLSILRGDPNANHGSAATGRQRPNRIVSLTCQPVPPCASGRDELDRKRTCGVHRTFSALNSSPSNRKNSQDNFQMTEELSTLN